MADPLHEAPRWRTPFIIAIGLLSGAAAGMNVVASAADPADISTSRVVASVGGGACVVAALLVGLHRLIRKLIRPLPFSSETRLRLLSADALSSAFALVTFAGAAGVRFIAPVIMSCLLLFILLKLVLFLLALDRPERDRLFSSLGYLALLFLVSGFAALIYQIVWQRALYAAFGVNIESITIIVSIFMFGLGLGSLLGGVVASRFPHQSPTLFLACEFGIGLFGIGSIPLIHAVARVTLHGSLLTVSLAIFALLVVPTMLMGATLPILVTHLHRHYQNVGRSVGLLYFINTLGSAVACFLTADVLFYFFGQQASVLVAAGCNLVVGVLVLHYMMRSFTASAPA